MAVLRTHGPLQGTFFDQPRVVLPEELAGRKAVCGRERTPEPDASLLSRAGLRLSRIVASPLGGERGGSGGEAMMEAC